MRDQRSVRHAFIVFAAFIAFALAGYYAGGVQLPLPLM